MPLTNVPSLNRSAQKTQLWLKDLAEIGHFDDEMQAHSVLRAVLHALRDRLTVDEAADLAAQLPTVVRGVYYEGWKPAATPKSYGTRDALYQQVREELRQGADVDAAHATASVFELLAAKVTAGEIEDVRQMMPEDLRDLWPEPAPAG